MVSRNIDREAVRGCRELPGACVGSASGLWYESAASAAENGVLKNQAPIPSEVFRRLSIRTWRLYDVRTLGLPHWQLRSVVSSTR